MKKLPEGTVRNTHPRLAGIQLKCSICGTELELEDGDIAFRETDWLTHASVRCCKCDHRISFDWYAESIAAIHRVAAERDDQYGLLRGGEEHDETGRSEAKEKE